MRVLVTGGAGFIASHLVDALVARRDAVVIVDDLSTGKERNLNPLATFHRVDIRDAGALAAVFREERPEIVSHHAAQMDVRRSMADPAFDAQVNVVGLVNLLQLCAQYQVRKVVFSSTSAVYSEPTRLPADETVPVRPQSAYGLSKHVGEKYLQLYHDVHRVGFTAFRYGNVYGPRQDEKGEAGAVAIFAGQMLTGVRPTLFGDGRKTRDYIHIADIVSANLLAIDGGANGAVLNLGWGREVTDFEVFDAVRAALQSTVEPRYADKRPGEVDRIALDSSRARAVLGWTPCISFEEGIRSTVADYRRELSARPDS